MDWARDHLCTEPTSAPTRRSRDRLNLGPKTKCIVLTAHHFCAQGYLLNMEDPMSILHFSFFQAVHCLTLDTGAVLNTSACGHRATC